MKNLRSHPRLLKRTKSGKLGPFVGFAEKLTTTEVYLDVANINIESWVQSQEKGKEARVTQAQDHLLVKIRLPETLKIKIKQYDPDSSTSTINVDIAQDHLTIKKRQ